MSRSRKLSVLGAGIALVGLPSVARADAGLPMIVIAFPALLIALVPMILLEAWYVRRALGVDRGDALIAMAAANLVSTAIGVPLTWLVLVVLQLVTGGGTAYGLSTLGKQLLAVTWQAPWLIPYESSMAWMVPAAALVLLVPFWFVSWQVEYRVGARWLEVPQTGLRPAVLRANLLSYAGLAAIALWQLALGLRSIRR